MNVKTFKDCVAVKCRQCVWGDVKRYEATPAELIEVCNKTTCGLYKVRPRIAKNKSEIEEVIYELLQQ